MSRGVQVPSEGVSAAHEIFERQSTALRDEFGSKETGMQLSISQGSAATVMSDESATQLVTLLCKLPHGVVKYSHDVPGQRLFAISRKFPHAIAACILMHCVLSIMSNALMHSAARDNAVLQHCMPALIADSRREKGSIDPAAGFQMFKLSMPYCCWMHAWCAQPWQQSRCW